MSYLIAVSIQLRRIAIRRPRSNGYRDYPHPYIETLDSDSGIVYTRSTGVKKAPKLIFI